MRLRFTCGEKKFGKTSKILTILWPWLSAKFSFVFYVLLTVPIIENGDILAGIYLIFLIERPKPNSKVL